MGKSIKARAQKKVRSQPRTKGKTRTHNKGQSPIGAGKPEAPGKGKLASVIAMLRRPKGATIADLCRATGWQAHSVRGALSGAIKKRLGLAVTSEKPNGVRVYRVAG